MMVWGSYNTGMETFREPGFPTNAVNLFHGLRAFGALGAAYIASLVLLARRPLPRWPFGGPLGLCAVYGCVGIISAVFLSDDLLSALYWGLQYGCVLMVLWAVLTAPDPLPGLAWIFDINWLVAGAILAVVLGSIFLVEGVTFQPGGYLISSGGDSRMLEVFGMPTTRATGIGRYAGVVGLVALSKIGRGKWMSLFWGMVVLAVAYTLLLTASRTPTLAFMAGAFCVLWLRIPTKIIALSVTYLAVLGLAGAFEAILEFLTRGYSRPELILSGRVGVWLEGLALFWKSPVVGFGFHADRIFVHGEHMHNTVLHALVQSGVLGTLALMGAVLGSWLYILVPRRSRAAESSPVPVEIPAVLMFFTVSMVAESTVAFFGAVWLMAAPAMAYVQAVRSGAVDPRPSPGRIEEEARG